jgi:hypothetical protein
VVNLLVGAALSHQFFRDHLFLEAVEMVLLDCVKVEGFACELLFRQSGREGRRWRRFIEL